MKTIRSYFNNTEAEFARLLLVSAGIEAVLAEENANTLGPGFAPGGVRLQVPEEDAERATEILFGRHEEFTPLPDEFVPPEEVLGEAIPPRLERFEKLKGLIPVGLCVLVVMGLVYALYVLFAPLNWTHTSPELGRMGIAAAKEKDYAKAIKYYTAALVINPRSAAAYFDRGLARRKTKDYEKAVADFTEAIQLTEPKALKRQHAESYFMRGITYRKMGRYDKALEDFNKAIELDPTDYQNYASRGLTYSQMGDANKAIKDFNHVIEVAPDKTIGYNNLAWLYATWPEAGVRNGAHALELATKACNISEWKKGYCIGTLAAAEAETGKFDAAVKHAQQALAWAKTEKVTDERLLTQMADALRAYQQKKPYRDVKK